MTDADYDEQAPRSYERREARAALFIVPGAIVIAGLITLWPIFGGDLDVALSAVLIPLTCVLLAYVLYRAIKGRARPALSSQTPYALLFFVPGAMLVVGSLSSGGTFFSLYEPVGFLLLLLTIASLLDIKGFARRLFVSIAALMLACGIVHKVMDPASWISYVIPPLFVQREIVDHPVYGKMVIDTDLHKFIDGICAVVHDGDPQPELSSLPFSYANYYCAIPPWHDYVQTWYDTTGPSVIEKLQAQFEQRPPTWILYQRELGALAIHEKAFNGGHALPQRNLDDLIMSKIDKDQWRIVSRQPYGVGSDWILVRTRWIGSTTESSRRAFVEALHAGSLVKPVSVEGFRGWMGAAPGSGWSLERRAGGGFTIRTSASAPSEKVLSYPIHFKRNGVVSVSATIVVHNLKPEGGYGYLIDLYDHTRDKVVGSTGAGHRDAPPRLYGFSADVQPSDDYQIRLRYQGARGAVTFANVKAWYGFTQ